MSDAEAVMPLVLYVPGNLETTWLPVRHALARRSAEQPPAFQALGDQALAGLKDAVRASGVNPADPVHLAAICFGATTTAGSIWGTLDLLGAVQPEAIAVVDTLLFSTLAMLVGDDPPGG